LIKKAELELQKLKNVIFDGKILNFEKYSDEINESIIGLMIDYKMHSIILPGKNQFNDLISLCEFPIDQKWTLIYRASQDGFEASSFHDKCDDKPNTLVVIKSTNGNVFGGYTEQSWTGSGFKTDPNAFIFSLINEDSEPLKIKCDRPDEAIYCSTEYGPNFGDSDIDISSESNLKTCCSNVSSSYLHPDFLEFFPAGCDGEFEVLELEIYTRE